MPGCPGLGLKDEMNNSGFVQGVLGFAWTDDPIVRSKWFRWVPRGFHRTDRGEDRFPRLLQLSDNALCSCPVGPHSGRQCDYRKHDNEANDYGDSYGCRVHLARITQRVVIRSEVITDPSGSGSPEVPG